MGHYREVSDRVMSIVRRHSERVEVAGLDEAYIDLSDDLLPKTTCRRIKHEIRSEAGLACSIGLAPNKLLAKIASDLDKPDGFRVLRVEQILEAVGDRPATLIPGVGPKTAQRLAALGISTVAELAQAAPGRLERALGGRLGRELQARANGVDECPVETERTPKSESRETTFSHDVDDPLVLRETLERLVAGVCEHLTESGYRGRTVTLKIRLRPFRTYTRSRTLEAPTCEAAVIGPVARSLLERIELDSPVRLLGVGLSGLVPEQAEVQLFAQGSPGI
jgi:DNA polymerase-4